MYGGGGGNRTRVQNRHPTNVSMLSRCIDLISSLAFRHTHEETSLHNCFADHQKTRIRARLQMTALRRPDWSPSGRETHCLFRQRERSAQCQLFVFPVFYEILGSRHAVNSPPTPSKPGRPHGEVGHSHDNLVRVTCQRDTPMFPAHASKIAGNMGVSH